MIGSDALLNRLVELCPDFKPTWDDERFMWAGEGEAPSVYGVFSAFSHYVAERLEKRDVDGLAAVFDFAEKAVADSDEDLANAAATCFLENLINRVPESIDPDLLVPLLGHESKEYCRAWDKFTGVTTKGLEPD